MKYCYSISKPKTFNFDQATEIFPANFSLQQENEETFIIVETEESSESEVFKQIQRECDRIFFLTDVQFNPVFKWLQNPNRSKTCQQTILSDAKIIAPISENITSQDWEDLKLVTQLRLWQVAHMANLPISAKINPLFQIIEIDYPDTGNSSYYPEYSDISKDPDPRTEALLLRNWVSHGSTKTMTSNQLIKYCQHLDIPENFHDCTNLEHDQILKKRVNLIEKQAREIIDGKITFVKKDVDSGN